MSKIEFGCIDKVVSKFSWKKKELGVVVKDVLPENLFKVLFSFLLTHSVWTCSIWTTLLNKRCPYPAVLQVQSVFAILGLGKATDIDLENYIKARMQPPLFSLPWSIPGLSPLLGNNYEFNVCSPSSQVNVHTVKGSISCVVLSTYTPPNHLFKMSILHWQDLKALWYVDLSHSNEVN